MITVAIQAGGQSRRMGKDKALVRLGGKPLIVHVLDRVRNLGDDLLVTTNRPEDFAFLGVRLAEDVQPGAGALAGLQTALLAARGETVLVLACDLPFLNPPFLTHMLGLIAQADVVVPRWAGEYEPLHAVYRRSVLEPVTQALAAGRHRVISFFPEVRVRTIEEHEIRRFDPDGLSFFNVNTPEDLAEAARILKVRTNGAQTQSA